MKLFWYNEMQFSPTDLGIGCPQTSVQRVLSLLSTKVEWQICDLSIISLRNPLQLFRKKSTFFVSHKNFWVVPSASSLSRQYNPVCVPGDKGTERTPAVVFTYSSVLHDMGMWCKPCLLYTSPSPRDLH